MKVSVIVVHWNTPELLRKQLTLVEKDENLQIIIVDNASEMSLDWIKKDFPHVTFIRNKENAGYGAAGNIGAKYAKGEWLLFLNPDVEITHTLIKRLISDSEKGNLDAASPRTNANYSKPLPTPFSLLAEFTPLKYVIPLSIFRVRTLFGGCLLIKQDVFKKVGGWDKRFFLWFEDSDITKRLIDSGYQVGRINIDVQHKGGASFEKLSEEKQRKIFFSSMQIYADKHFGLFGKFIAHSLTKKYT